MTIADRTTGLPITRLSQLDLFEAWSKAEPGDRVRFAFPIAAPATGSISMAYAEIDPGGAIPWHVDSAAEEILLVLEGRVEVSLEGYRTDGYANNQDNKYAKTFNKLYVPAGSGDVTLAFQGYWARWHAPSYIDRDLVRSGALDEKTAVNPTDGGKQNNQLAYLRYRHARDSRDPFSAIVYADHRDWTRWRMRIAWARCWRSFPFRLRTRTRIGIICIS